ncbi:hypothetical protein HJ590_08335 [Naumannella sp. ID2617S]|nr:hypothetical protein [Naumannella sp. ID2617S]
MQLTRRTGLAAAAALLAVGVLVPGLQRASTALPTAASSGTTAQLAVPPAAPQTDLADSTTQAVQRDLRLSPEEYAARSAAASRAGEVSTALQGDPGFSHVSLAEGRIVVWGSGTRVEQEARRAGAEVRGPLNTEPRQALLQAFSDQVGPERLAGLQEGADGSVTVTVTGEPTAPGSRGRTPVDFARQRNVQVATGEVYRPNAGPVRGGEGFTAYPDGNWSPGARCTTGLTFVGPDNRPRMVSSGHCTDLGNFNRAHQLGDRGTSLGVLEAWQFGGGTDLSIWKDPGTTLLAEVATYGGAPQPVSGRANPVVGMDVCVAGATTMELRCGKITSVGGANVQAGGNGQGVQWVEGFAMDIQTMVGDSGAPVMAGSRAVGLVTSGGTSAGGTTYVTNLNWAEGRGLRLLTNAAPNFPVVGAIAAKWNALGGLNGFLGQPLAPEGCGLKDGGCWQPFAGGKIHWSPKTGAFFTRGLIQQLWEQLGWENGVLGYPTTDENCGLKDGGCWQGFQGGTVHWSAKSGANFTRGLIQQRWSSLGWENGVLGYPTTGENCGLRNGGCWQGFQGGSVYWSPNTGAHFIRGAIRDRYGSVGWEGGQLGFPRTDELCGLRDGGCWQQFEGGRIYWSPGTGAQPVWGAIGIYWDANGIENGRFGYPAAGESCGGGGCSQRFQGGTITWHPVNGTRG